MDGVALRRLRAEVVNAKELPTIPPVLTRLLSVVEGDRSSVRDLVAVIEQDQALTARILRLANSAFFGFPRAVSTLSRAVTLLGFSAVKNLALGVKVWETLAEGAARHVRTDALWLHSMTAAAASRVLAVRLNSPDSGEVFTAGLLHDVGKLVLCLRLPAEYVSFCRGQLTGGPEEFVREREVLGVDHAEVGGWLAEAWRLPAAIAEAVAKHHQPLRDVEAWRTPQIVNLANRVAGCVPGGAAEPPAEMQAAGVAGDEWQEMLVRLSEERAALADFFGLLP